MSQMGDFWHDVDKRSKSNNQNPVEIGQIISLQPLTIGFQGLDLSVSNGDKIYLNNLLLDANKTFTTANPITCSDGTITENHTDIINDITQWLTSIHQRFILSVGDNVAVQRLGNNTYIVLEKVQQIE
jgi:hypothetical protein